LDGLVVTPPSPQDPSGPGHAEFPKPGDERFDKAERNTGEDRGLAGASGSLIDLYRSLPDSGRGAKEEESATQGSELEALAASPPPGSGLSSGRGPTVFVPKTSTPLEENNEGDQNAPMPEAALWTMKYRRHWHVGLTRAEDKRLRLQLGDSDEAVYVIDDGEKHHMVARVVGTDAEGSTYCLIGRISATAYDHYANGEAELQAIFSECRDLALCSAFVNVGGVSNVLLVETYRRIDEVPSEYLPSSPPLEFGSPS
jgi:hypothetical protein